MRSIRRLVLAVTALAALALVLPGVRPVSSTARAADDPQARLGRDPQTGRLIFVGTRPGQPLPSLAAGVGMTAPAPEQSARSFIQAHAADLGLRDADSELSVFRSARRADGRSVVRYRQVYNGVPVFGADVVVNLDRAGSLVSLGAKISPELSIETEPTITAEEAAQAAVVAIAKYQHVAADTLQATTPELWIYDSRLLLPEGRPPVLTWKLEVGNGLQIDEMVLVNAARPSIALHYNQIDARWGKKRAAQPPATDPPATLPGDGLAQTLGLPQLSIYTMGHDCLLGDGYCSGVGTALLPGTLICDQATSGSCASDTDAWNAYQYGLDTYNFYANYHGRDSIDGGGMPIIQSVHYGLGYMNAYWSPDGEQMVYGDGFSAADDVVAHELTHGVTAHTSGLLYFGQSGALSESLSDIWGEFVDQTNGRGLDIPAVKWLIGEDVPGLGAIRSMKNPPLFKQPDSMTSSYYYLGYYDNYGVHTNSGVGNKTAYLLVEGGIFGGKTIQAIGLTKTADIFYEVQTNLLGSGSNYIDLYYDLQQACFNLVGTNGITMGDCQAVRDATEAVKMNKTRSGVVYPTVDYCPVGQVVNPVPLFEDDFESGAGQWTLDVGATAAWALDTAREFSSGGSSSLVWTASSAGAESLGARTSADIALPAGSRPFLRFEHMFDFETNLDGGLVAYSTNGGANWYDLSLRFAGGKNYNGTLSSSSGNPNGGHRAFTGYTVSYTESLYNLSTLAGQNVRFAFFASTDNAGLSDRWFIDNVRVYTCVAAPPKPLLQTPGNGSFATSYRPTLNWSDSAGAASYNLQLAKDSAFTTVVSDVSGLVTSDYTAPGALDDGTKYYWRVRSLNSAGDSLGWTGTFNFYIPMWIAPTGQTPSGAAFSRRPTFDWTDVGMATGYTVQVSTNATFTGVIHTGTVTKPISTYTPLTDLPASATLYWHVRANTPKGAGPWSAALSFTTGNPPGVPLLLAPATNALTANYTPTFDWTASIVPPTVTLMGYQLQVDDDADFTSPVFDFNVLGADATSLPSALAAGTKFYWRVRALSTAFDSSGWSAVRTLRTVMAAPTLSLPSNGGTAVNQRPAFDWSDVFGATGYTIQISRVSTFSTILRTGNIALPISTYMPATALPAGTAYWRVRANGPNGPSAWSSAWSVIVP